MRTFSMNRIHVMTKLHLYVLLGILGIVGLGMVSYRRYNVTRPIDITVNKEIDIEQRTSDHALSEDDFLALVWRQCLSFWDMNIMLTERLNQRFRVHMW